MPRLPMKGKGLFWVGLGVRLIGVFFLWLGDGGQTWWRKGSVVLGVILSIGGLAVLRFLLLSEPLARLSGRWRRRRRRASTSKETADGKREPAER